MLRADKWRLYWAFCAAASELAPGHSGVVGYKDESSLLAAL